MIGHYVIGLLTYRHMSVLWVGLGRLIGLDQTDTWLNPAFIDVEAF